MTVTSSAGPLCVVARFNECSRVESVQFIVLASSVCIRLAFFFLQFGTSFLEQGTELIVEF